ncbi:MAG: DUF2306 domain-containing protein [Flavobacteriales bacterium]|nr:DUF2306 domain-containing protein [Flavobacteriales bacterium]
MIIAVLILFFSWLMLRLSIPYLAIKPGIDFLKTKTDVYHLDVWRIGFYMHVFSSVLLLIAGGTQFSGFILHRYPSLHRIMGWIYVIVLLLISGPGAAVMALYANGGLPAKASFTLLTFLWYVFTIAAFIFAMKKKWILHARFMLRSYALTFSAVTLRLLVFLFISTRWIQAKPQEIYVTVAWLSWVPNLIVAELLIDIGVIDRWMKKKLFTQE